jgi:hypothetical protein
LSAFVKILTLFSTKTYTDYRKPDSWW